MRSLTPRAAAALERGILITGFILAVVSGVVAWQVGGPYGERLEHDPRASIQQDPDTGLTVVAFDSDGNLTLDTKGYLDGERLVRLDEDEDEDGVVDRREHYGASGQLERVEYLDSAGHITRTELWANGKMRDVP